ncbi:hypothetical protein B9Z65_4144 [Elsinoe australis]|uniref:Uncharacterized protein n=1 Tax=Elsinoe australis TaxID=40998 RepID=A0A2P7Z1Y4_9PEZI|nr:hypothetical protein B9Z65_4144 [Elsinoe australis]
MDREGTRIKLEMLARDCKITHEKDVDKQEPEEDFSSKHSQLPSDDDLVKSGLDGAIGNQPLSEEAAIVNQDSRNDKIPFASQKLLRDLPEGQRQAHSVSAQTMSLEQAIQYLNSTVDCPVELTSNDELQFNVPESPGIAFYAWQIIGIASILGHLQSAMRGVVLGDDTGPEKTNQNFGAMVIEAERRRRRIHAPKMRPEYGQRLPEHDSDPNCASEKEQDDVRYAPTMIVVPPIAVRVFKDECANNFARQINLKIWFGSKAAADEAETFIHGGMNGVDPPFHIPMEFHSRISSTILCKNPCQIPFPIPIVSLALFIHILVSVITRGPNP